MPRIYDNVPGKIVNNEYVFTQAEKNALRRTEAILNALEAVRGRCGVIDSQFESVALIFADSLNEENRIINDERFAAEQAAMMAQEEAWRNTPDGQAATAAAQQASDALGGPIIPGYVPISSPFRPRRTRIPGLDIPRAVRLDPESEAVLADYADSISPEPPRDQDQ